MDDVQEIARPGFGRLLTLVMVAIGVLALVVTAIDRGAIAAIRLGPWMVLLAGGAWALFWRPHVAVDDGGVRLVNVLRTVHVPWPAIRAIDTKWALTLVTAHGTFVAWAAPAPGVHAAMRSARQDAEHLPIARLQGEGMRPGDLPSSSSGDAAQIVRRRWEELRDAGHLDDPKLEHDRAPTQWHLGSIVCGAALAGLAALSLVV